jgi:hypothetical protein
MAWTTPSTYAAGEILTAASLNTNVRDNTNALYTTVQRLAYQQRTTDYSAQGTEPGTNGNIFTSNLTWTADGTSAYRVEFFASLMNTGTSAGSEGFISFVNSAGTSLGRMYQVGVADGSRSASNGVYISWYYTPTAGAAAINARGWRSNSDATIKAGTSGAGNYVPMFMAVYGPALA